MTVFPCPKGVTVSREVCTTVKCSDSVTLLPFPNSAAISDHQCIGDCILDRSKNSSLRFPSKFLIKSVFSAFLCSQMHHSAVLASLSTTPSYLPSFLPSFLILPSDSFSHSAVAQLRISSLQTAERERERYPRVRRANESCPQRSLIHLFYPATMLRLRHWVNVSSTFYLKISHANNFCPRTSL